MDIPKTINNTVVKLLTEKGKTVALAESCTGGLVAKKITDVSGASECFECGFVTYSNEQKIQRLGVMRETLERYGAVSYQTALEMCKGAKEKAGADIGVGITGIAGPGGGTPEKPVGLVYIGICTDKIHIALKLNLSGSRDEIRDKTSLCALDLVRKSLMGEIDVKDGICEVVEAGDIW